jgi:hypothetical protein
VGLEIFDGGCTGGNGNSGIWIFRGSKGEGYWAKDKQIANLTIERFDLGGVVIRREDLPNSSSPGFVATYEGRLHDGRIEGKVTASWLGHFPNGSPPGTSSYTWYGTVPATTCDVNAKMSAEEAFETGTKAARFRQSPSAFQCFQIAADQGDGQSKMAVGLMYRDGIGTKVDYKKAIDWLTASAVQGDYNAQLALEQMYESGIGTPQDNDKATMWRQRAQNNPVVLQQQQKQKDQEMLFMGLAALIEAASQPTYRLVTVY